MMNMFSERVHSRGGRREATRARVTEVAERLFLERGFAATTIRDIAAEAGVSTGTVMSVGDKDGLLVAIFDARIERVHEARASSAAEGAGSSAVVELARPFLELFSRDLDLARHYAAILVRGAHESVVFTRLASLLTEELRGVIERSGVARERSTAASRALYLAYIGILFQAAGGTIPVDSALDELGSAAAALLGEG